MIERTRAPFLGALTALTLLACEGGEGSTAPGGSDAPPARARQAGIQLIRGSTAPTGSPATRFGAAVEHELTPVEAKMAETLSAAGFDHDPAMSRMVRNLASSTPSQFDMPASLVDGLLAHNGIVHPPPHIIMLELDDDADGCSTKHSPACEGPMNALLEEAATTRRSGRKMVQGVGVAKVAGGQVRMAIALGSRSIDLEPLPALVRPGQKTALEGRLADGLSAPRLEIVDGRGKWRRAPIAVGDEGSVQADLACDQGKGTYQIELLADGEHGPEVVANFPLYCGVPRPAKIEYSYEHVDPSVQADQIARANFDLLNAERADRGLPALGWDARAADIALRHSQDMVRNEFFGHVSPTTGGPTDRFRRAKVEGAVIRENVGLGYGPAGIHDSLMNSPGHRVNILAEDVTHVGIGVVIGEPRTDAPGAPRPTYLTQNYYARPGADVPRDPAQAIRDGIAQNRKEAGLARLRWDPKLAALAQVRADAVATGSPAMPDEELMERVAKLGYGGLGSHQVSTKAWRAMADLDLWKGPNPPPMGIGVAQAADGTFVMIVLIGES